MPKPTRKQSKSKATKRASSKAAAKSSSKAPRATSKQARLIEMLRRSEGATLNEIVKALAWQAHTVRGAISGALKKKLGLKVESEKVVDRGRVYRIAA
jgi:transposase